MIIRIAIPPFRLSDRFKNTIPCCSLLYFISRCNSTNKFSSSNLLNLSNYISPCLSTNFIPVKRWQYFKKQFLASGFKCSFVNSIPDAFACFVDITILLGSYSSTGTVSHPFGAFHRAYKCGFLEQTVSAHPATKKRPFYTKLDLCKKSSAKWFLFKRVKCRLPSA